jgi:two-component system response regulator ResD
MDIKILVADDDPVFRELVCDIVKKQGFIAVEASDGRNAVDVFFASNDIDLIILDVMMPVQDGWEVLKEISNFSRRHEAVGTCITCNKCKPTKGYGG